jgi:hypothetical protein
VKIVKVQTLISAGTVGESGEWTTTRNDLHKAIQSISWPPGSGSFTIYPESGKKRGEGNGVKPIKNELLNALDSNGWLLEHSAKNALGQALGDFDALKPSSFGPMVVEWETGNISSSHRSLNKMTMLLGKGIISTGTLVVPSRRMYVYLTDRIGNEQELEPYYPFWGACPVNEGVLEIVVIEQDGISELVPRIPKGTDGRARS